MGFGDAYNVLARESGALLVEKVLEGIIGNSDLMSDLTHPNEEGYAIMAKHFYQVIKPYA
jgi:lysophospholipase L1-like esterase